MSSPAPDLDGSIARLDELVSKAPDEEKLRAGLGMRLALGMAREISQGAPLGSQTAPMLAEWTEKYGQNSVEAAVSIAREFMTKPEDLRKVLGRRLGLDQV